MLDCREPKRFNAKVKKLAEASFLFCHGKDMLFHKGKYLGQLTIYCQLNI